MKYLVTGGAGFIGSHLSDTLLADGHDVVALDNLATGRAANLRDALTQDRFRLVEGSVLDARIVDDLVRASDVVVHLAAAVGVHLIVQQPLASLTTNIRGAENVLAAAYRHDRKVLVTSSSEIYGKNGARPLKETDDRVLGSPSVTRWVYSTSKAVDEILSFAYHKERGLPTVVVRLFNTVGPRQSAAYGMVIPRMVQQALRSEPMTVYGDGTQTRCFCHVADVVDGLCRLLAHDAAIGEVFNVGTNEEVTILMLAERIKAATSSSSKVQLIPYAVAYEPDFEDMQRRVPDTTKMRNLTGCEPNRTLDDILHETIAYARAEQQTADGE